MINNLKKSTQKRHYYKQVQKQECDKIFICFIICKITNILCQQLNKIKMKFLIKLNEKKNNDKAEENVLVNSRVKKILFSLVQPCVD